MSLASLFQTTAPQLFHTHRPAAPLQCSCSAQSKQLRIPCKNCHTVKFKFDITLQIRGALWLHGALCGEPASKTWDPVTHH